MHSVTFEEWWEHMMLNLQIAPEHKNVTKALAMQAWRTALRGCLPPMLSLEAGQTVDFGPGRRMERYDFRAGGSFVSSAPRSGEPGTVTDVASGTVMYFGRGEN